MGVRAGPVRVVLQKIPMSRSAKENKSKQSCLAKPREGGLERVEQ